MNVFADVPPYSDQFPGTKRLTKANQRKSGVSFEKGATSAELSYGWKSSNRVSEVHIGDKSYFIDTEGYFGFSDPFTLSDEDKDLITYAFEKTKSGRKPKIHEVEGIGHIAYLKYNAYRAMMFVEFANGDKVVYFNVARYIWDILKTHAESKALAADGKHHLLGIAFWDYIRHRGSKTATRLPYATYEENRNNRKYAPYTKESEPLPRGMRSGQYQSTEMEDEFVSFTDAYNLVRRKQGRENVRKMTVDQILETAARYNDVFKNKEDVALDKKALELLAKQYDVQTNDNTPNSYIKGLAKQGYYINDWVNRVVDADPYDKELNADGTLK